MQEIRNALDARNFAAYKYATLNKFAEESKYA